MYASVKVSWLWTNMAFIALDSDNGVMDISISCVAQVNQDWDKKLCQD